MTGECFRLGEATARLLVKSKAKISSLDVEKEKANTLASELRGSAIFHNTDVKDEYGSKSAMKKL